MTTDTLTTHLLQCSHCIGTGKCREYLMRCNVLKDMGDGRLKIEVFGERNWRGREHIRHIRYVAKVRVLENTNNIV